MLWSSDSRKRFLFKVSIVGALAPAIWVGAGYALRDVPLAIGQDFGLVLYWVSIATFPTQFIFLDAENLTTILFLLVVVAPVNGAWYVLVTMLLWLLRDAFQRVVQRARRTKPSPSPD